jgi:hypothetical protein
MVDVLQAYSFYSLDDNSLKFISGTLTSMLPFPQRYYVKCTDHAWRQPVYVQSQALNRRRFCSGRAKKITKMNTHALLHGIE